MFLEADLQSHGTTTIEKRGWIEAITGCMFSGKTEELIRRVNRAIIAKQRVLLFKPSIDTRYHLEDIVSHNENSLKSIPVSSPQDLLSKIANADVIGIDEIQFFDSSIVSICNDLANEGKRIIVAGLDMDYEGVPFDNTAQLMAKAEFVTKLQAICMKCGANAAYSFRLTPSAEKILVGQKEHYEARCRKCFQRQIP